MPYDAERIYRELGRLIEEMPDLKACPVTPEVHRWVGRAFALVSEVGNGADATIFSVTSQNLGTTGAGTASATLIPIVYRALSIAERNAPSGAAGSFIPVGNSFDAFAALAKLLGTAQKDVLIVDPYMDETVLTDFASTISENVSVRLMASASCKPSLQPAAIKWQQQYGAVRPLMVRIAPPKALHDRAIFIDQTAAYALTQSLKDFAKRSPAEIVRADDTAALKIEAYENLWASATVVV